MEIIARLDSIARSSVESLVFFFRWLVGRVCRQVQSRLFGNHQEPHCRDRGSWGPRGWGQSSVQAFRPEKKWLNSMVYGCLW